MDVFISWSGDLINRIATLIRMWLKVNLQSTNPFLSSKDIGNGAQWSAEINERLQKSNFGIICLTAENKTAPWILFESGACSKGFKENKIATVLIDIEYTEIDYPLAQFHHTFLNKESFKGLLKSINNTLRENDEMYLEDEILNEVFENNWLKFEADFSAILSKNETSLKDKKPKDKNIKLLEDILESIRGVEKRVSQLEFQDKFTEYFLNNVNIEKRISDAEFDTETKIFLENLNIDSIDSNMLATTKDKLECIIDAINKRFQINKSFNQNEILRAHKIRDQAIKTLQKVNAL